MRRFERPKVLADICRLAASRCQSDAAMYRQLASMPPVEGYEGPLGTDAARLAREFEGQAREALELADVFDRARSFSVELRPEPDAR